MVVLAISAFEKGKNGQVIFSRQFLPIARSRIDSLLQAFPRLMGAASEHTFIETDSVRYVYQSHSDVLLVMITNRLSTLVQDLETLRLVQRTISERCGGLSKQKLVDSVFDIFIALDEVVNLGYHESITVDNIHTNLEMDSHEEYLHNLMQQAKINAAKQQARTKAAEIAKSRQQQHFTSTTKMESYSSSQLQQDQQPFSSSSSSSSFNSMDSSGTTPFNANKNSFSSADMATASPTTSLSASASTTATSHANIAPSFSTKSTGAGGQKLTFTSQQQPTTLPQFTGARTGPTQSIPANAAAVSSTPAGGFGRKTRGFKTGLSLGKKTSSHQTTTFEGGQE